MTDEILSLWGECGDFAILERFWRATLGLAQHYGWEPAGTLPPDPDYVDADLVGPFDSAAWDGCYYPARLQRITKLDAEALAVALEAALADIPDADAAIRPCGRGQNVWLHYCKRCGVVPITNPLAELSGSAKVVLRLLIRHCRECAELWIG